jgi:hypothetical protein
MNKTKVKPYRAGVSHTYWYWHPASCQLEDDPGPVHEVWYPVETFGVPVDLTACT